MALREWKSDLEDRADEPPTLFGAFRRRASRLQLQRPALLPVVVTILALLAETGVAQLHPPLLEPSPVELTALSGTFAVGMLTVFTLLAGMVAGFTFVIIGTLGASFTAQLSDPAIRAPRLWLFLAFSLAGTCTSMELLVSPPPIREVFAIPIICLLGAFAALAAHLHGVSLDANPAALMRRLTDNDTPPVGFAEWGRGRPIQVGLATVRAALSRRDAPTATAVTLEVVRACAHFQGVLMRIDVGVLRDPERTWGLVHIASVQNELRHWVDELERAEVFTPGAFDAAGQLLVQTLIWETTLTARLGLEDGRGSESDVAEDDLVRPVLLLLNAGEVGTGKGSGTREALVRGVAIRAAALGGALCALDAACAGLDREASAVPGRSVTNKIAAAVTSDLVSSGARLLVDYAGHLGGLGTIDRYERHLVETANADLVCRFRALRGRMPYAQVEAQLAETFAPNRITGMGGDFVQHLLMA